MSVISNGSASGSVSGTFGDDIFIGSTGNDNYNGLNGFDIVDYTNLGSRITLRSQGVIEKLGSGTDTIQNVEAIIGASGQRNTIDGRGATTTSFNINLGSNFLEVRGIPGLGNVQFSVLNFIDVRGTENDDIIIGNLQSNTLEGFGGNDYISGGAGDDRLIGEQPNSEVFGNDTLIGGSGNDILDGAGLGTPNEVDWLTGGTGADIFSLQDDGDVYDSLSVITDFNFFEDDKISLPGVGASAFNNSFDFQNGSFSGLSGAFLTRTGPSVFGQQVAFFQYNINGGIGSEIALDNLFSSSFSPII